MTSKINIVLLCAGKSSRLKFNLPKVILPINGKTLLQRSLHSLGKLSPSKTIIVAGFKKELVINLSKTLNYKNLNFVVQKEQLGTGDAVKKAASSLDNKSIALIMNGDTPFVDEGTINQALSQYRKTKSVFTIATTKPSSPFGYGRILRDNDGQILDIVEEKDCDDKQKLIKEVNAGLYLIATDYLKKFVCLLYTSPSPRDRG